MSGRASLIASPSRRRIEEALRFKGYEPTEVSWTPRDLGPGSRERGWYVFAEPDDLVITGASVERVLAEIAELPPRLEVDALIGELGSPPCAVCQRPKSEHFYVRMHETDPDHKFVEASDG